MSKHITQMPWKHEWISESIARLSNHSLYLQFSITHIELSDLSLISALCLVWANMVL